MQLDCLRAHINDFSMVLTTIVTMSTTLTDIHTQFPESFLLDTFHGIKISGSLCTFSKELIFYSEISRLNPYLEIVDKKSTNWDLSERHLRTKNPQKFFLGFE